MKKYPISRKTNLVVQKMDKEVLIYDLSINKAFCLNETSAIIWEICDGDKSIAEIRDHISKKLNETANEELVWLALEQLKKENLIENTNHIENKFTEISRREIIKKVGLGTMIALPVVASVIAPSAVNAASGGGLAIGAACTMSSDCSSSNTIIVTGSPGSTYNTACTPGVAPATGSATTYTGACCRTGGSGAFGNAGHCVAGGNPGATFTVVQGCVSSTNLITSGGTVVCAS